MHACMCNHAAVDAAVDAVLGARQFSQLGQIVTLLRRFWFTAQTQPTLPVSHTYHSVAGGYTTGRADVVQMLRQRARPYLFSNTLAPPVAAASLEVFRILEDSTDLRDKLERNTLYFREHMTAAGFKIRPGFHPIVVRAPNRTSLLRTAGPL